MSVASSKTGYVVSDLHIFSCASRYQRLLPMFYEAVRAHSVVVLNGDTFDFKRSHYPSSRETVQHAVKWLEDLCARFPTTQIHYLLGNHDCHSIFVEQLLDLQTRHSTLQVREDTLILSDSLFIHGDVVDLPEDSLDLSAGRRFYAHMEPSLSSKAFAQLVTRTRLNLIDHLRHSRSELARRLLGYIRGTNNDILPTIKRIYFGHTHVPFQGFEREGVLFYNTGSMIRGCRWMPAEFDL
jgi:UDP-2,3-diacylglucosamine pyrophosphatase LpxH